MPKLLRAIGMTSLFSIAVLAFSPIAAIAGDDTAIAKELYEQAKAKGRESSAAADKMLEALDRGDTTAVCLYARQSNRAMQVSYDLALRMTKLDLDPQNAEVARGLLSVSGASLESSSAIINLPECNAPAAPVVDYQNDKDMNGLNAGVRQAREADVEGKAAYASGHWEIACDRLGAAEQWYAFNSNFALEVSAAFSAKNNPQPQLAGLSTELAGLAKTATPLRMSACRNKLYGVDLTTASISAQSRTEIAAFDKQFAQYDDLLEQFDEAKAAGKFDVACPVLTNLMNMQKSLEAKSALLILRYNTEGLRSINGQFSAAMVTGQKLKADHCSEQAKVAG